MDIDEIVDRIAAWDRVLVQRPAPGDGSPEISWGDAFFYFAPGNTIPPGQPFATIVTKDYPDDRTSELDRPSTFRLNVAAGKDAAAAVAKAAATVRPNESDVLFLHPVYGQLGWLSVVNPGERTREQVFALLEAAHDAARTRWQRRRDIDNPN